MSDTENSHDVITGDRRTALAGEDHAGWRLDRFLAAALPDFSRSRLKQLLDGEAVSIGARTIKDANHRVKPGESYVVTIPPTAPYVPRPACGSTWMIAILPTAFQISPPLPCTAC